LQSVASELIPATASTIEAAPSAESVKAEISTAVVSGSESAKQLALTAKNQR
jgi:hypothetical protein